MPANRSPIPGLPTTPVETHPEPEARLTPEESALGARLREGAIRDQMTEMGQKMQPLTVKQIAEQTRKRVKDMDGARDRLNPKCDKFSPTATVDSWQSPEAAAQYENVGPDRAVVWKRRPEIYKDQLDEVEATMYRFPDAKIVKRRSDGKALHSDDLVAISIPIEIEENRVGQEAMTYEEWIEGIQNETQHDSVTRNAEDFEDRKRAVARAAVIRNQQMGIGRDSGSPTSGMDYVSALRMIPKDERLQMEERNRNHGRHIERDEAQARIADQRAQQASGRKTFGGMAGPPGTDNWQRQGDQRRAEAGKR